jgi:nucleoside-diphosphate-sugar epimerase
MGSGNSCEDKNKRERNYRISNDIRNCFPKAPYDIPGTFLIVGGLGYVGCNTVNTIFDKFPNLHFIVLDNLIATNANIENIRPNIRESSRFEFIEGSMQDVPLVQSILTDKKVSLILHLAAFLPWQKATNSQFLENNVNNLNTFLETCSPYCKTGQIKHILYQSSLLAIMESSFVFNSTNYTNTFPMSPNIYITTKTSAAALASFYIRNNKMPVTTMYPSHIFGGSNQHKEDSLCYYQNQLLENKQILVSPFSGTNYDNWISICDVIDAYILILLRGYDGSTYNLVNPSQTITYLDTQVRIVKQLKPCEGVRKWLKRTNKIGVLNVQTKGFVKKSNLPCFDPKITLQSEISEMPILDAQ